jgi:hypothetical protein
MMRSGIRHVADFILNLPEERHGHNDFSCAGGAYPFHSNIRGRRHYN